MHDTHRLSLSHRGKRMVLCSLACAVMQGLLPAQEIQATRTAQPPAINGRVDSAVWQKARPIRDFKLLNTEKPSALGTEAYVLYDDSALYIGVRCPDKDVGSLKRQEGLTRDSKLVFAADLVEFMIDPGNSKNDYYHIAITAFGDMADRVCTQSGFAGDFSWNGAFRFATSQGKDDWSCTLAVPYNTLGLTPRVGTTWGLNICRTKQNPQENASIARAGAFNIATSFRPLTGLDTDFSKYLYAIDGLDITKAPAGSGLMRLDIKANLSNLTGKDRNVLVEYALASPSGKIGIFKNRQDVKNGEKKDFSVSNIELSEQGSYVCTIRVMDPATKKVCLLKQFPVEVKYTPVVLRLLTPWYRHAIFASQHITNVVFDVEPKLLPDQLKGAVITGGIRKTGEGNALVAREFTNVAAISRFEFPVADLPDGRYEVFGVIKGAKGEILAEVKTPLEKLPPKNGEVWMDRNRDLFVDGKPFFLIGGWGDEGTAGMNAAVQRTLGAKRIESLLTPINNRTRSVKTEALTLEDRKIIADLIRNSRDKPELFAYFLCDEPEQLAMKPKALAEAYDVIAAEDPYHPVLVCNDSIAGLRDYLLAADINGFHPYPQIFKDKQHNDMSSVTTFMDAVEDVVGKADHKQSIAYMHQGFNYGDFGSINNRIPSYREYRDQDLLAVISGAQGIIEYNWRMEIYPELSIGMPALTRELGSLSAAIVATGSTFAVDSSCKAVRALAKTHNGQQYFFVCNAQMADVDIALTIPGLGKVAKQLTVFSEGRSMTLSGDAFADHFYPYQVHVYTTSANDPELPTIDAICALIDAANAAKRKPGNLAFELNEGDGVAVTASSNAAAHRRPDNALWHVVDGVVFMGVDYENNAVWHSLPGQEHWIEVRLPAATSIARVVVYPFKQSLKDYAVQAFANGAWTDVDRVTGRKDARIEHAFAPVTSDRIRLSITAVNGTCAEVSEIEVYGPASGR